MKKILGLTIIAFLVSVVMPLRAMALSGEIFASSGMSMTETTEDGATFSLKNGNENTTLYIGANVTSGTLNEINAHVELENSSFTFSGERSDYRLQSGWTGKITKSETGNGIDISLTNETGITSRKIVASISLQVSESAPSTDTCRITLSQVASEEEPATPKCQIVDDTYYDANGNEVSEEAYKASCTTAENPQTGSFLPYTLIIAGLALAGWLYYVTKKNNKIYQV